MHNCVSHTEEKILYANFVKFDEDLKLAIGFAMVCKENGDLYWDTQDDHIPESSMLDASLDFMANSRVGKTMHDGDKTGDVVFAFPLTTEIAKELNIKTNKTGLLIGFRPTDATTLTRLRNGELTGFSIGGIRITDEVFEDAA